MDTLRDVARRHAGPLGFIIGGDSLPELAGWREPQALARLATFVVLERPGFRDAAPAGFRVERVEFPPDPVASAEIRRRVAAGESIDGLVAAAVADCIAAQCLYRVD